PLNPRRAGSASVEPVGGLLGIALVDDVAKTVGADRHHRTPEKQGRQRPGALPIRDEVTPTALLDRLPPTDPACQPDVDPGPLDVEPSAFLREHGALEQCGLLDRAHKDAHDTGHCLSPSDPVQAWTIPRRAHGPRS